MSNWWDRPYRIVQTNLRMPDAGLDPRRLARQAREFNASAILFNVGGIFAFYPTELPLQARNPMLKGDLLGEMLEAAHAEGLKLIGRFDLSKGTRKAYEAHPDWFVQNSAGEPIEYNGTYQACVNGGWYNGYAHEIIREALGRYPVDGVFFNMFGYITTDYHDRYRGICVCRSCRDKFRSLYGRDLPASEDFSDPAYADYVAFQERTSQELGDNIYRTVKAVRPEVAVTAQRTRSDVIRLELQRSMHRKPPEWPYQSGEQARWAAAFGRGRPYSSAATNFVDFAWRFVAETGACQTLRFAQQLANGASPDYYLLGTFDQDDKKPFPAVADLFKWHANNDAHYARLRSVANVALYHSHKSTTSIPMQKAAYARATTTGAEQTDCFRGAYRALLESRIPFDFISDERIAEGDAADLLKQYEVILLPNVACLSDVEASALDQWVEAGGTLVVTGETGLYDERGNRRPRFALASLAVTNVLESRSALRTYFEIGTDELAFPDTRLMMLDGRYFVADRKPGAETLLRLLPSQRFGPPELCYADDEARGDDLPGVVIGRHGQGRTIYLPWLPEWHYQRESLTDHRALIQQLVTRFATPVAFVQGVGPIEVTLHRQQGTNALLAHVVNYAGQRNNLFEEPAPLHGLRFGIREAVQSAHALVAGTELAFDAPDEQGVAWATLPPVSTFEALSISVAKR